LGVGAILGGFVSGFLSDKIPIMKVGKSTFLVLGISMFLSLPLFMELIENFVYSYFLGFVWGFAWHYMDGWLWVTCSKIFEGKL
jgi:predicted MFS family arabinose efflux permease